MNLRGLRSNELGRCGAERNGPQCGDQRLWKGQAARESLGGVQGNEVARHVAKRNHLQRLDQCMHELQAARASV